MRIPMILLLVLCISLPCFATATPYKGKISLQEVRDQIRAKGFRWIAGETSNSRLPAELRYFNVMQLDRSKQPLHFEKAKPATPNVKNPAVFTWRDYNGHDWITPIRNQASCGSCWAFGTVGAWEAVTRIAHNAYSENVDYSEQYLVSDCFANGNCGGSWPSQLYPFLKSNGCVDEACWPYEAKNAPCGGQCSDWQSRIVKMDDYAVVDATNDAVKQALQLGPISCTMNVYEDFYNYYTGGVYHHTSGVSVGLHVIVIFGWNDDEGGYWYCKNSWGANWGEQGFFRCGFNEAEMPWAGETHRPIMNQSSEKSITVVYPNGGEQIGGGTNATITWTSIGAVSQVDLSLSTDNGSSWQNIATQQPNNGEYAWSVPQINAMQCLVKVKDSSDTEDKVKDQSNAVFEIYTTGYASKNTASFALPKALAINLMPIPFFDNATIRFDLPKATKIDIALFDMTGRKIASLTSGYHEAGRFSIKYKDTGLQAGVYVIKLTTSEKTVIKRVLHLK
jgi:hypothetical protein